MQGVFGGVETRPKVTVLTMHVSRCHIVASRERIFWFDPRFEGERAVSRGSKLVFWNVHKIMI